MAKAPRKSKAKAQGDAFASSLGFVASILKDKGDVWETHCRVASGTITAANAPLAAGILTDVQITAQPNCKQLITALQKCSNNQSITELANGNISVKSEKFSAVVQGAINPLPTVGPDPYVWPLSDKLMEAAQAVALLADEDSDNPKYAAVCIQGKFISATNGYVALQAWHDLDLPPCLMLPKKFWSKVLSYGKELTGLGLAERSITFYFADNSWLKTQLYNEEPPGYNTALAYDGEWSYFPPIWEGLDAVLPFSDDYSVYISQNKISSHETEGVGASYDIEWPFAPICINGEFLKLMQPYCGHIGLTETKLLFQKFNVRGGIALKGQR